MSAPDRRCDGCGRLLGRPQKLWLAAPLGWTVVYVHKHRPCAEAARQKRGGGRFIDPGPSDREKLTGRLGKPETPGTG